MKKERRDDVERSGRIVKPIKESSAILWDALSELAQENLFLNPLEPTEEEINNFLLVLSLLATEIFRTVLTQTYGPVREAIVSGWLATIQQANKARRKAEGLEPENHGQETDKGQSQTGTPAAD
jgi:hypothetical protein